MEPDLPSDVQIALERIRGTDPRAAEVLSQTLHRVLQAADALTWARDRTRALREADSELSCLQLVVQEAVDLTGAPEAWAMTWFMAGDASRVRAVVGRGAGRTADGCWIVPSDISRSVLGEVARQRRPAWSDDATTDARFLGAESIQALALRSIGCVPLGEQGALYLHDPQTPGRFSATARARISALCALAAEMLPHERAEPAHDAEPIDGVVGSAPAMREVYSAVRAFAPMPWPVLILGETGTGKEAVARAVHSLSTFASGSFVAVNCGTIAPELAESTLFGHERGAFTGADRARPGLVDQANQGTLFLDEVGELPGAVQTKLLRILQEGVYRRVGDDRERTFNGRIVAATHRQIHPAMNQDAFRADLYHRLSACVIRTPPLRDRLSDLAELAEHLLKRATAEIKGASLRLGPDTAGELRRRTWPGNVRELDNVIKGGVARALHRGGSQLEVTDLPPPDPSMNGQEDGGAWPADLIAATEVFQQQRVRRALEDAGDNKTRAAELLGVSRQWLHRLISRWESTGALVSNDLDRMLERMVPGAGHRSLSDADAPMFPSGLDLTPIEVLARGAVGWVFRAHDPVLDREVAVKVSRPDGGAPAREALLAEARTTSRLAHPAVLPLHRVQASDGRLCVVFALGPVTTLAHQLADWRQSPESAWPPDARLACLHRIAEAVAHAHTLAVVHGDLKPAQHRRRHRSASLRAGLERAAHPRRALLGHAGIRRPRATPRRPGHPRLRCLRVGCDCVGAVDRASPPSTALRNDRGRSGVCAKRPPPSPTMPPLGVEPTLGDVLLAAAAQDPGERPTAEDLVAAVADALTGRARALRRRGEAEEHLSVARRQLQAFHERERRLQNERRVIAVQRARIPPHAPAVAKEALWASEVRAKQLLEAQALAWTEALEHAVAAAHLEPQSDDAHGLISELWYERLGMAESRGYEAEDQLALARIRRHDRGRFIELINPEAHLTLQGHGEVTLLRVEQRDHRLEEVPYATHSLPVQRLALPSGSWIVEVQGLPSHRIPVALARLEHVELTVEPPEQAVAGFCYVAAGPFHMGGDAMARQPVETCTPTMPAMWVGRTAVTSAEYLAFLRDLDPEEANARAPAQHLVTGRPVALWEQLASGWALPEGWSPRWPVVGVSLDDAVRYASWRSAAVGLPLRLPTEDEWEKFARGADARPYPWGDGFDPSWCHMRDSVPGSPHLLDVESFDADVSPVGVRDVAGGVHEWTTSVLSGSRHVVRGGSWASDAQACRLASRSGAEPHARSPTVGFRVVASAVK